MTGNTLTVALERMTVTEKYKVFAAIAKEFIVAQGATMIPVQDEGSMIGAFFPTGSKADIIPANVTSPYLDEIRERAKSADRSISLEEFIVRLDGED